MTAKHQPEAAIIQPWSFNSLTLHQNIQRARDGGTELLFGNPIGHGRWFYKLWKQNLSDEHQQQVKIKLLPLTKTFLFSAYGASWENCKHGVGSDINSILWVKVILHPKYEFLAFPLQYHNSAVFFSSSQQFHYDSSPFWWKVKESHQCFLIKDLWSNICTEFNKLVIESYRRDTGPLAQLVQADQNAPSTQVPFACVWHMSLVALRMISGRQWLHWHSQ